MAAQEKEGGGGGGEIMRDYRKGNWTVQETMILIEAKKMDDERRKMSRSSKHGGQQQQPQPAQPLRWKWVEEYCWRRGCQRSQNQCNDKWDNLMRDYKKVREYQRNLNEDGNNNRNNKSYWEMDRAERKEKGLPTNMLPQIYQALYDVVEKPGITTTTTATTAAVQLLPPPPVVEIPPVALLPPPPPILSLPPPRPPLPPPPLLHYSHQHVQQQPLQAQPSPTSLDSESEHSHPESPAKRRKSRDEEGRIPSSTTTPPPPPPPTTTRTSTPAMVGGPSSSTSTVVDHLQEVGNAICRSATMIAESIQAGEEREERRHREIVSFHESSLRLQESRMEIHRQGLNALTDAINNLASSILHWANSQKNQGGGGGPSSS